MTPFAIVTDSSASIPEDFQTDLNIHLVPIYIHHQDQVWREIIDIKQEEFYSWLPSVDILPTTAYPGPGDFFTMYESLLNALWLHAGQLSGYIFLRLNIIL